MEESNSQQYPLRVPWIETPLIESSTLSKAAGCRIFLKLELLQPSGSFKFRGIGNLILTHLSDPANRGKSLRFYSSSGGNAGLAAVTAARNLGCQCIVIVPLITKPVMIQKLWDAGAADVIQHGASWYEADQYLKNRFIDKPAEGPQLATSTSGPRVDARAAVSGQNQVRNIYVPPFDDPLIWEGVSTIIPELVNQLPPRESQDSELAPFFPADIIICSVGGGGLFNGIITGFEKLLKTMPPPRGSSRDVHVLAVETDGADSLAYALRKGQLQPLPVLTSLATSLGALCVAQKTYENAISPPAGVQVKSIVVSDAEAARGVLQLADEVNLLVELACGVSLDVATGVRLKDAIPELRADSRVVVVLCGGSNITAEAVVEYRRRLKYGWSPRVDQK